MKAKEFLAACFFLFGALLIWPLITIANRPVLVGGVPALVVYLFTVWAVIVGVLVAVRRPHQYPRLPRDSPGCYKAHLTSNDRIDSRPFMCFSFRMKRYN